uniref:Uncharacterized protein n=1 Tax=Janibacter limosus TaxID=53458 RepID=A0AC61U744_9MICO|nr:hypothetical protein [Janibacter limosus]
MTLFIQQLINGPALGGIYCPAAIGLTPGLRRAGFPQPCPWRALHGRRLRDLHAARRRGPALCRGHRVRLR